MGAIAKTVAMVGDGRAIATWQPTISKLWIFLEHFFTEQPLGLL